MLKFAGTMGTKPLYGFGLNSDNLEAIKAGGTILVDLAELGGVGNIIILHGETDEKMTNDLRERGFLTEQTIVNPD